MKRARKRTRLTHFEIRRNGSLMLRLAIADDELSSAGEELGALIRKLAPVGLPALAPMPQENLPIVAEHVEESHHADTRAHLAELVSSLCDTSLADAEEIVRNERARRMEGTN